MAVYNKNILIATHDYRLRFSDNTTLQLNVYQLHYGNNFSVFSAKATGGVFDLITSYIEFGGNIDGVFGYTIPVNDNYVLSDPDLGYIYQNPMLSYLGDWYPVSPKVFNSDYSYHADSNSLASSVSSLQAVTALSSFWGSYTAFVRMPMYMLLVEDDIYMPISYSAQSAYSSSLTGSVYKFSMVPVPDLTLSGLIKKIGITEGLSQLELAIPVAPYNPTIPAVYYFEVWAGSAFRFTSTNGPWAQSVAAPFDELKPYFTVFVADISYDADDTITAIGNALSTLTENVDFLSNKDRNTELAQNGVVGLLDTSFVSEDAKIALRYLMGTLVIRGFIFVRDVASNEAYTIIDISNRDEAFV